jgi:hypothetical protein
MTLGQFGGVFVIALVTVMLGVAVGGVLFQHEIGAFFRRLHDRIWPPPEPPASLTIERIARQVRQVRAELNATPPGTPMARRVSVLNAYDDLLAEACRALDVPDTLTSVPQGIEREAERLHVEHELTTAGLRLTA